MDVLSCNSKVHDRGYDLNLSRPKQWGQNVYPLNSNSDTLVSYFLSMRLFNPKPRPEC